MLRGFAVGLACSAFLIFSFFVAGCYASTPPPLAPVQVAVQPVTGPAVAVAADGGAGREAPSWLGVGYRVEVEWHGSWWPAVILDHRGERFLVHYDDYGADWDEVVAEERIRERRVEEEPGEEPSEDGDP